MPMSRCKTTASALCSEFSRFFPEWQVCKKLDLWKRFAICYWNPMLANLNAHLKWTIFEDRCSRQQAISRGTVWECRNARDQRGCWWVTRFTFSLRWIGRTCQASLRSLPKLWRNWASTLAKAITANCGSSTLCPRCSQLERRPCNTAVSIYHTFLAVRSAHFDLFFCSGWGRTVCNLRLLYSDYHHNVTVLFAAACQNAQHWNGKLTSRTFKPTWMQRVQTFIRGHSGSLSIFKLVQLLPAMCC